MNIGHLKSIQALPVFGLLCLMCGQLSGCLPVSSRFDHAEPRDIATAHDLMIGDEASLQNRLARLERELPPREFCLFLVESARPPLDQHVADRLHFFVQNGLAKAYVPDSSELKLTEKGRILQDLVKRDYAYAAWLLFDYFPDYHAWVARTYPDSWEARRPDLYPPAPEPKPTEADPAKPAQPAATK
jgi:hypothetical protein